jgi:hypothetical protein
MCGARLFGLRLARALFGGLFSTLGSGCFFLNCDRRRLVGLKGNSDGDIFSI